jgi:hypothetical protein
MKSYDQTISRSLYHKIASQSIVSKVLEETALSKGEVVATWTINELGILKGSIYGYVGNIGIKSFIHSSYRPWINLSYDIDLAVSSISNFEGFRIKKERLIEKEKRIRGIVSNNYEIVHSPFEAYILLIYPIKISSHIELEKLDIFDIETGIGPISLYEEDFIKRATIGYIHSLPLETQLATHISPLTYNGERIKRAFFASVSNDNIDLNYLQQKLEESVDRIRSVGLSLNKYKKGFEEVAKGCEVVEAKFRKRVLEDHTHNIENWREIVRLLFRLSEAIRVA